MESDDSITDKHRTQVLCHEDEQRRKAMYYDFGALGYSEAQISKVLGISVSEVKAELKAGASELMEQGKSRFKFAMERKLLELASQGDLKAVAQVEKIWRINGVK